MKCELCGYSDGGTGDMAHACIDAPQMMRMTHGNISIVRDEIAEKLDELADLGEYWKRHRALGRSPQAIRAALVMTIQECAVLVAANARLTAPDTAQR